MPILQVTKQELVEAKLEYILVDPQKFAYVGKVLIDKTKD